jgi:hypothetical protein
MGINIKLIFDIGSNVNNFTKHYIINENKKLKFVIIFIKA